jgi:hypothetical protein
MNMRIYAKENQPPDSAVPTGMTGSNTLRLRFFQRKNTGAEEAFFLLLFYKRSSIVPVIENRRQTLASIHPDDNPPENSGKQRMKTK